LASQSLNEHAVLWRHVFLKKPRKYSVVVDKRSEPLRDLTVCWVKELSQDRGDGLLLQLDMRSQLSINIVEERGADILQPCFLGLRVGARECAQSDRPGIVRELFALFYCQFAEKGNRVWSIVANVGADEI
jgi:hypothetical protein